MGMSTLLVRMLTMAATLQLLYTAQALHNSPNCAAIDERLRLPCVCSQEGNGIHINCDKVSFPGDFPILPQRVNIVSFQQRKAGIQALTAELFTNANLPIAKVDFSENSIRRLSAGVWTGLEDRIQELFLRSNLLGDTYSPVFSSPEIANLTALVTLDLGYNGIREVDVETLEPLKALQVLRLEGNHLTEVPTAALEGLAALRVLTLQENNIGPLVPGSFSPVSALVFLNLSNNNIPDVGAGAFAHLPELTTLDLSHNRLDSLESGSLQGLDRLEELDLSDNFLTQVPVEAIMDLRSLKTLVLKDNLIQNLGGIVALGPLLSLRKLDLSRCSLGQLNPGTFRQLKGLVSLKLSVNSIRKIEDEAFDGLDSLEELHLDDDKILSVPSVALAKVPLLKVLTMDYNRVGVISASSFENVPLLQELSIAHNIIREIPADTFSNLTKLTKLNLYGNLISTLSPASFVGLKNSLSYLNLGLNQLNEVPNLDFPNVSELILSQNNISSIHHDTFLFLPELKMLDLSENVISTLPVNVLSPLSQLTEINLSKNLLTSLKAGQFKESVINVINLSGNQIKEVQSNAFQDLLFIHTIDLGNNRIERINDGAFFDTPYLHILRLNDNKLNTFREEFFRLTIPVPSTELRLLDVSKNEIVFLQNQAFKLLSKLTWINLSSNRISLFPAEVFRGLPDLQHLYLENNEIERLNDNDLANSQRLRELNLSHNKIQEISEKSLQNSTQLQVIDLSHNDITHLPSDVFVGLSRVRLDLSHNNLRSFPDSIFQRTKIQKLQDLNLAHNKFTSIPVKALRQQYFFLSDLSLAHNRIKNVPSNADIIVNIKGLDLSYNPLTKDDISVILNEPKTLRYLNLAGTNISEIPVIEARFLLFLNISDNHIRELKDDSFALTRNLHTLDVSKNKLKNLSFGLASAWPKLPYLRYLDISYNPFMYIIRGDLGYLAQLKVLKATHMDSLSRVERSALQSLKTLEELHLHSLPAIHSMDARGILESLPGLKVADIEITDSEIHDQLHPAFTPRLESLIIRGKAVEALSGGAFAGINSPVLNIGLVNTSVSSLFSNAFFPVPMSSQINLDVSNNKITSLSPQFLNSLNPRQRHLQLDGLDTNPLFCDCNARPLQRWLGTLRPSDPIYNVTCSAPAELLGRHIRLLKENELTCDGIPTTTTTAPPLFTTTHRSATTDNIITIEDVSSPSSKSKTRKAGILNDMDILIIGIVGGVISFVAFVILIACLVKYICDSSKTKHPVHMAGVPCTCLKPPMPPPSWGYPQYPTLPHPSSRTSTLKLMKPPGTPVALGPQQYGTLGARSTRSYHSNGTLPYYLQNCPPDYDQD
ncbi:protein artichoke isoform X2 [Hyalella azteca]|uniref:Protein artichoke isoform X1 n=1 Tax=Hyalella azteca TaxID=294128 RepID=A0A8B7NLF6_HYAAZ|nr:protein artichoke isoform X1 [Hyalella azteca]XP_018014501.1 protein artichoke isoform X1 [Hyalella azteca]XP_047736980.1 protein artichoke isoform X2 [Hyalella azteca]